MQFSVAFKIHKDVAIYITQNLNKIYLYIFAEKRQILCIFVQKGVMKEAKDPLTGEVFVKRRSNQVFANRENQIRFNNIKAQERRKATAQIDRVLKSNLSILKRLLNGEKEVARSYDFLSGAGFNFGISTHAITIGGKKWNCIYDHAYTYQGNNQFIIMNLNDKNRR